MWFSILLLALISQESASERRQRIVEEIVFERWEDRLPRRSKKSSAVLESPLIWPITELHALGDHDGDGADEFMIVSQDAPLCGMDERMGYSAVFLGRTFERIDQQATRGTFSAAVSPVEGGGYLVRRMRFFGPSVDSVRYVIEQRESWAGDLRWSWEGTFEDVKPDRYFPLSIDEEGTRDVVVAGRIWGSFELPSHQERRIGRRSHRDGSLVWELALPKVEMSYLDACATADLDRDGIAEIALLHRAEERWVIEILSGATGLRMKTWGIEALDAEIVFGSQLSPFHDLDGDGTVELLLRREDVLPFWGPEREAHPTALFSPATGKPVAFTEGRIAWHASRVGPAGKRMTVMGLVQPNGSRDIGVLEGTEFKRVPFRDAEPRWLGPRPALGDFDGDGKLDLLLAVGVARGDWGEGRGDSTLRFYSGLRSRAWR